MPGPLFFCDAIVDSRRRDRRISRVPTNPRLHRYSRFTGHVPRVPPERRPPRRWATWQINAVLGAVLALQLALVVWLALR